MPRSLPTQPRSSALPVTTMLVERLVACLAVPVFARIGPTKCTEWQMSWGLVFPPGLEPDRWCMPVCVLRAPLYVYYLYFSEKTGKGARKNTREKKPGAHGEARGRRGEARSRRGRPVRSI